MTATFACVNDNTIGLSVQVSQAIFGICTHPVGEITASPAPGTTGRSRLPKTRTLWMTAMDRSWQNVELAPLFGN